MVLKQKIAKNFLISFVGRITASALGLVSFAFITRALGVQGFGDYSIILAFLYVFSVFADFGLYNILTREISKPEADEKSVIANIFITRLLLLVFFLILSIPITYLTPYSAQAKTGILIAIPGIIFLSLSQVLMGVYQKYLKTITPAVADVSARLFQLAAAVYLYKINAGLWYFALVFVVGGAINFFIVYYFARRYTGFSLGMLKFREVRGILKESWPLAASSVFVLMYFKGDTIILSLLKPAEDVGIYNLAYRILENIIFFPAMFVGLVMPLLSKYFFSDPEKMKAVFQKTLDFLLIIVFPLAAGGIYLALPIIRIISGSGFDASSAPFQILMPALIFIFLGSLFGNTIIALRKQKEVMYVYGSAAILNILGNLYFINKYSYLGAAWMTVFTEFFVSLAMFFVIYKTINYLPKTTIALKSIIAALAMFFILLIFPWQNFWILFSVGTASYFVVLYLIKGISKQDITDFVGSVKV